MWNTRQLTESVPAFLSRLPPSTSKTSVVGPWIYVHNPHRAIRNENVPTLTAAGMEILWEFEDKKAHLEAEHAKSKSKSAVGLARKVNPLRRTLEKDIFALARRTGVVTGKWMLFPSAGDVDEFWAAVAGATVRGDLGISAKVATYDDTAGGRWSNNSKPRLLAIYTRDYEDRDDVRRVLEKLVDLGVVRKEGMPVYYKFDALTYLGVMADNPYGLKASLFSSRDVFMGKI